MNHNNNILIFIINVFFLLSNKKSKQTRKSCAPWEQNENENVNKQREISLSDCSKLSHAISNCHFPPISDPLALSNAAYVIFRIFQIFNENFQISRKNYWIIQLFHTISTKTHKFHSKTTENLRNLLPTFNKELRVDFFFSFFRTQNSRKALANIFKTLQGG